MTREEFRQELGNTGVREWCYVHDQSDFLYSELELEDWEGIQEWYNREAVEILENRDWSDLSCRMSNWIDDYDLYGDDLFAFDDYECNWYPYEFGVEDYERLEEWLGDDYFDAETEEPEEDSLDGSDTVIIDEFAAMPDESYENETYKKLIADRKTIASVPEMELFQII